MGHLKIYVTQTNIDTPVLRKTNKKNSSLYFLYFLLAITGWKFVS